MIEKYNRRNKRKLEPKNGGTEKMELIKEMSQKTNAVELIEFGTQTVDMIDELNDEMSQEIIK